MIKSISQVDISSIKSSEQFFVDTNVLCAIHFRHSQWLPDKLAAYSAFILALHKNHNTLYVSAFSLQELYHLIERAEYRVYNASQAVRLTKKQFRGLPVERANLAREIRDIHTEIASQYKIANDEVRKDDMDEFVRSYCTHSYDPIDFIVVNHYHDLCNNFITDDSDFQNDSRLTVYTYV